MTESAPDKIVYVKIPDGHGGRAEMVRMVYALAGKPYEDVFVSFEEARSAVEGKNPFKQFPFVETANGELVYQTLAIMCHAAHGTPAWPSDPGQLTQALSVALGAYDLYQAFGAFPANDEVAKQKFEGRRLPQFFSALDEIYSKRDFATGATPTFADCIAHQAVAWCVRANDAARAMLADKPSLVAFQKRLEAVPAIKAFMAKQSAARATDGSV
jgi:glutathione S-transferase